MNYLTIKYNKNKCVGAKKCIEAASSFFSFENGKAELKNSNIKDSLQVIHLNLAVSDTEKLKTAAELCPVNAIEIIKDGRILVSDKIKKNNLKIIRAEYDDLKEFVMDPNGYFLIKIDKEKKVIEVGFCPELNKVTVVVRGLQPLEIYQTAIKNNLISRLDHAAYLGRELQKAYIALQTGIKYIQDDELVFQNY